MREFHLDGQDAIRLSDLLKVTGHCGSGGEAKHRILNGEVRVDGVPETRKGRKIKSGQVVELAGCTIRVCP